MVGRRKKSGKNQGAIPKTGPNQSGNASATIVYKTLEERVTTLPQIHRPELVQHQVIAASNQSPNKTKRNTESRNNEVRSVRSVVILNSELNQFHPDTIASEEMVIKALTKEDANEDVNEEEYLRNVAKERCEQLMSQNDFPRFNMDDAFEAAALMVAIENNLMEMLDISQIMYDNLNDNAHLEEFLEEISVPSNLGASGGEMDIDLDAEIDPELAEELEKLPLYSLPETLSPKKITANSENHPNCDHAPGERCTQRGIIAAYGVVIYCDYVMANNITKFMSKNYNTNSTGSGKSLQYDLPVDPRPITDSVLQQANILQEKVRSTLSPQSFTIFEENMEKYAKQEIEVADLIARIMVVFKNHPELMVEFGIFLPPCVTIELHPELD